MSFVYEFFETFHILPSHLQDRMALLSAILSAFSKLPYENVSKIISFAENGTPDASMRMPSTVWEEYRTHGLGGTCFSLTNLLKQLLQHCGFSVSYFLADMRMARDCHCGLIVHESGRMYLTDPGYLISYPIDLSLLPYHCETPLNDVHVTHENNSYCLYTSTLHSGIKLRYRISSIFTNDEIFINAWKRSFGQNSMRALCLNRTNGNEQVYFQRDFFRISTREEKKNIKHSIDTIGIISEYFAINPQMIKNACDIVESLKK